MECAGIAEAGGVKNVTYSLCKELSVLNNDVTLFIPIYKCSNWDLIKDYKDDFIQNITINHCGKQENVNYCSGKCTDGNFKIVFIKHNSFLEKEAVYTYTAAEQEKNSEFVKGFGHKDTLFMDSLFVKSVVEYGKLISENEIPEIIHCQDASTALLPSFISKNDLYKNTTSVVTIHNAGPAYHHNFSSIGEAAWYTGFSEDILAGALNDFKVEPFLLAANAGAHITTVSEFYAKELIDPFNIDVTEGLSPIFFKRNTFIKGITNGIDFERYDPSNKNISLLPYEFNPQTDDLDGKYKCREYFVNELQYSKVNGIEIFGNINSKNPSEDIYISYHGRITNQKGITVLINAIPALLNNYNNLKFIIAGQGELALERELTSLTNKYNGKVIFLNGYNRVADRMVNAIGDFIVLPSFFEPCGLEDFISQIYGTIPVAHSTGGLNKIIDRKTGFLYSNNNSESLIAKLSEVISIKKYKPEIISKMIKDTSIYIKENYEWRKVIEKKYLPFFKEIIKKV